MLKKLLKHEWKATWRNLTLLNGGIILLGILGRIMIPLVQNSRLTDISIFAIASVLCILFYIFAIFAVAIVTNVLLIGRFYRNMFTDEGYLMHTLPVTPGSHIISKLLVYMAWFVIDGFSLAASISILLSQSMQWGSFFGTLWDGIQAMGEVLGTPSVLVLFYLLLTLLAVMCSFVLCIYFSASVGNLFNSHKKLGAVLCYVGINMAVQFLQAMSLIFFNWDSLVVSVETRQAAGETVSYVSHVNGWPVLLSVLLFYLLLDALYFLGTQRILAKQLNLE